MITRQNYIEYFVDYYDGNLPSDAVKELFAFLDNNPELKKEFEEYGEAVMPEFSVTMPDALQAGVSEKTAADEFELNCIRYIEGEIGKDTLLNEAGNDNSLLHTISLYEKTRVKADGITFPNKEELLKKRRMSLLKMAAVILPALLAIPVLLTNNSGKERLYKQRTGFYTLVEIAQKPETNPVVEPEKQRALTAQRKTPVKQSAIFGKTSGGDVSRNEIPPRIAQARNIKLTTISYDITYLSDPEKPYPSTISKKRGLPKLRLKDLDYVGLSLSRRQNLKMKFKDNRLSYFALNAKNFFVKIKKSKP